MAEKRNLTVQLDAETIRKAKILAAERETSISRMVAEEIERLIEKEDSYRRSREEALKYLRRGFHLGGGPYPRREELHERGAGIRRHERPGVRP